MTARAPGRRGGAPVREPDLQRFEDYFYKRTGIRFPGGRIPGVARAIASSIDGSGHGSFQSWFTAVRYGQDRTLEREILGRLTVHETYFMREDYQLDCLVDSVLPAVVAVRGPRGTTIRILSVPCSTGDEPYSIAITLLERWSDMDAIDVEIRGLDVDAASVDAARAGLFRSRALHRLSPASRNRWFTPVDGGLWRISEDLRTGVDFRTGNLCEESEMRPYRGLDVIFCRNLLIYFDEVSVRRAAANLYGMLRPGGYLFLGHTESMSRVSPIFEPVRFASATVYRRPGEEEM